MSHTKLLNTLRRDFHAYTFVQGDSFMWSSTHTTITYPSLVHQSDIWNLFHEIAHAELNHLGYALDIELIACEVQAWEYAATILGPLYGVQIHPDHIEDHLDTYRYWLHARSACPSCDQNGFQITQNTYNCNNCRCLWRANNARICQLRRTKLRAQNRSS